MTGVFFRKGMTVAIKPEDFKFIVDEDGAVKAEVVLSLHFDVMPTWIKFAIEHLENCRLYNQRRQEAWKGNDEEQKAETLEKEFEASMQSIIAMAIAIDSFYGTVKSKINIPKELTEKWKENRTSRYIQIAETVRQGFKLDKEGYKILKQTLKEIFRFRDMAIHPKGDIEHPILHPDLGVGVEWRFVYFSYANSKVIVDEGLKRLHELLSKQGIKNKELEKYCLTTITELHKLIQIQ
ncbi:hypothetical protein M3O96_15315 [Aquiflexum sp. TKW24L]|uniref:hypothetical protein n=1 Tax=Aquiflexum sp. TKW24L TaxID=2942212 RepID=UPI0020C17577|nr:hypothetical protein [Aquiflexum sp. TKW24L]MCL6260471.1 hypothetical protein [Aquiflexum sp. TKW24L]